MKTQIVNYEDSLEDRIIIGVERLEQIGKTRLTLGSEGDTKAGDEVKADLSRHEVLALIGLLQASIAS
ncbi:hypothetical protein [Tellurirhabdus bombi]|uniref:hypothetical protein n=1 Tax=Tellurirhabdus bombi TaxID=2907205 RepID=UPI001F35B629|nr:hypothetical protein [Tellurirhabdus bombi]